MPKRMLIDASHPEETRVVVYSGNRLEEFDYESASKKQLKGNIYLAKITRVEPSLQAAFVDYGGNRHGFLPFSEIHPDYYRIPIADREALIAEEASLRPGSVEEEIFGESADQPPSDRTEDAGEDTSAATAEEAALQAVEETSESEAESAPDGEATAAPTNGSGNGVEEFEAESSVDVIGGDEVEDAAQRRARLLRRYKIQEVIKRRQVILVQVTKEERGNKGAALTTYLSLAGRYCVLMPNTGKGGGISRKISNAKDRRRLKKIVEELDIPDGVAVIVRTAGSERTKAEIRRDYEYLLRLWNDIRETTLASTAPCLIYEEASLIKRGIRDLYQPNMDEILVEGEDGYKTAKDFMKSLMPSHARKVKLYKDAAVPLFYRYQVESQIDAMHNATVQLKSGGYVVINMTEALVAIDVNSGKATRERHIEETAY
ncbi:MAG TPA: Rne/Rng family ribonuclease, partial [Kiloniellales bacterium]|nr:Rne/Rng family ribonuclease [Kiloniellales bacterium]